MSEEKKFISVEVVGRGGPFSRRAVNKILERIYRRLIRHWHANFRPKHFTMAAKSEYGYAARQAKYEKRKRRQKKHNLPLVWSGESRDNSKTFRVVSNSKGARCVMPTLRTFNFRGNGSQINMREEFTRTSKLEIFEYNRIATGMLDKHFKDAGNVIYKVNM